MDESAEELRLNLETALSKLNDDFLRIMSGLLELIGYPHHTYSSLEREEEIYELLEETRALSSEPSESLVSGDPFGYSTNELEELYKSGAILKKRISKLRFNFGLHFFKDAAQTKGEEAERVLLNAQIHWWYIAVHVDLHSVAGHVSSAKIWLKKKE